MQPFGVWYKREFQSPTIGGPDKFWGSGVMVMGAEGTAGMFTDLRTPEQMSELCCPPQLFQAMLGELDRAD